MKEWQKRYRLEQQQLRSVQAVNSNNSVNPEIHRMTIQVREVLPHVPYNVIYKDLGTFLFFIIFLNTKDNVFQLKQEMLMLQ